MSSIFEMGMLICFGISWPFNIAKLMRTKSTKGVSLIFLIIVEVGYTCGIIFRVMNGINYVLGFYILDIVLVGIDLALYFYYGSKEKKQG